MPTSEDFEKELQEALSHLHDPDYQPSELLFDVLGCKPQNGALAIQSTITTMIETLKPADDTPAAARILRSHEILYNRYILKLTVEQTADRMAMGASSVRRAQREARHWLAGHLWQRHRDHLANEKGSEAETLDAVEAEPAANRRSQIEQDLASLRIQDAGVVAHVEQVVAAAVTLQQVVAQRRGVTLLVSPIQPGLTAAAHPSALRQVLLMAIGRFIERATMGTVDISATESDGQIELQISCQVDPGEAPANWGLVRDIMSAEGGSAQVRQDGAGLTLNLEAPAAGSVTVLVVDDNPDIVYFYQRCIAGTRYRVVHESRGQRIFAAIAEYAPAVIVLDIMLPDVDGWELLSNLHNHPTTRSIPVLICSVVQEDTLARTLGATQCLHKPLSHAEFIEALDRALGQTESLGREAGARS